MTPDVGDPNPSDPRRRFSLLTRLLARERKHLRLVAQSMEAARPVAGDRGIELAMQPNGEARVRIDRTRVAQVLDNLLFVESAVNRGTTFRIALPTAQEGR